MVYKNSTHGAYRTDIDGLRAIAILSVLGYHIFPLWVKGGNVGVDIFFVISGYLISSIVLKQVQSGTFSVSAFYIRRIRRILPALLLMLCFTTAGAFFTLFPNDMIDFSKSLVSALFSMSNYYFYCWAKIGYFAPPAEMKPLLHTWSLGVEEQFYFIFPLIFLVFSRGCLKKMHWGFFFLLLTTAAFISSLVMSGFIDRNVLFYLTVWRIWEIALGVFISTEMIPRIKIRAVGEAVTCIGAFLIAVSVGQVISLPLNMMILFACVGTALIIFSGISIETIISRSLSLKPIVFIGLISYSLYLWHWPVLVLYKLYFVQSKGSWVEKTGLLITIFLVSWLSWKYIEQPFRKKLTQKVALSVLGIVFLGLLVINIMIIFFRGFPERFQPEILSKVDYKNNLTDTKGKKVSSGGCFMYRNSFNNYNISECLSFMPAKKNYLLIGDSRVGVLYNALSSLLTDVNILQATGSPCDPDFSKNLDNFNKDGCQQLAKYVKNDFLPGHRIEKIIISRRWDKNDLQILPNVLAWANKKGMPVIVFGPTPMYDRDLPGLISMARFLKAPAEIIASHITLDRGKALDNELRKIVGTNNMNLYISMWDEICQDDTHCTFLVPGGTPIFFDAQHLSVKAASYFVKDLFDKNSRLR